jgi:FkbM family methyltransferase
MFRSNGQRLLSLPERAWFKFLGAVRQRTIVPIHLNDRGHPVIYLCETGLDALRPVSLWIKEQGTMEWIESEVKPDDTFMDIGANIGIYTIASAVRMGSAGKVYAFEPHKVNALSLMRNIDANALGDRIEVFSCALSDSDGMLDFNYVSLASASTASQLGHCHIPGTQREFVPVASEKIYSTSVDNLLRRGVIRPPSLVKIDVDGNEIAILKGMAELLRGPQRPRAVQVELNVGEQGGIIDLMKECGYELAHRHLTYHGKQAQASGLPLEEIAHNAVFRPSVG